NFSRPSPPGCTGRWEIARDCEGLSEPWGVPFFGELGASASRSGGPSQSLPGEQRVSCPLLRVGGSDAGPVAAHSYVAKRLELMPDLQLTLSRRRVPVLIAAHRRLN